MDINIYMYRAVSKNYENVPVMLLQITVPHFPSGGDTLIYVASVTHMELFSDD